MPLTTSISSSACSASDFVENFFPYWNNFDSHRTRSRRGFFVYPSCQFGFASTGRRGSTGGSIITSKPSAWLSRLSFPWTALSVSESPLFIFEWNDELKLYFNDFSLIWFLEHFYKSNAWLLRLNDSKVIANTFLMSRSSCSTSSSALANSWPSTSSKLTFLIIFVVKNHFQHSNALTVTRRKPLSIKHPWERPANPWLSQHKRRDSIWKNHSKFSKRKALISSSPTECNNSSLIMNSFAFNGNVCLTFQSRNDNKPSSWKSLNFFLVVDN